MNGDHSQKAENENGPIEPEYTITNRYGVDMSDYGQSLTGTPLVRADIVVYCCC